MVQADHTFTGRSVLAKAAPPPPPPRSLLPSLYFVLRLLFFFSFPAPFFSFPSASSVLCSFLSSLFPSSPLPFPFSGLSFSSLCYPFFCLPFPFYPTCLSSLLFSFLFLYLQSCISPLIPYLHVFFLFYSLSAIFLLILSPFSSRLLFPLFTTPFFPSSLFFPLLSPFILFYAFCLPSYSRISTSSFLLNHSPFCQSPLYHFSLFLFLNVSHIPFSPRVCLYYLLLILFFPPLSPWYLFPIPFSQFSLFIVRELFSSHSFLPSSSFSALFSFGLIPPFTRTSPSSVFCSYSEPSR